MNICLSHLLRKIYANMIEVDEPEEKKPVEVLKGDVKDRPFKGAPAIKPKRRRKTLSDWDYRSTGTEYMQKYRAEGRDSETGNKYVKKLKGE